MWGKHFGECVGWKESLLRACLGQLEPGPHGGGDCPAWEEEIQLEALVEREGLRTAGGRTRKAPSWDLTEEAGESTKHATQGGRVGCLRWEQGKQLTCLFFFEFTTNLKIFIKFVAIVHLCFREQ